MPNLDAFGHPKREYVEFVPHIKSVITKYGLELEKETGTTHAVIAEEIDVNELVESFRDQTGYENAMRLIKSGQVSPDEFADDGKHGADITNVPDYAGDLLRQEIETKAQKEAIKQAYGLSEEDLQNDDLEAVIKAAVEKRIAEIQAQAQGSAEKEGE